MGVIEISSFLLEFITFYIIFHFFINISFKPAKKDIAACFIFVFISILDYKSIVWSFILGHILSLIYAISYRKHRLVDRFLLHCITYSTVVVFQLVLIFSLAFCNITFEAKYMPIIGNLLTIGLVIVVFSFTPYRKLYQFISKAGFLYKMLLINSYFIVAAILLFMKIKSSDFYQNISYFITIIAAIITLNACILYYDQKLYAQHQLLISYQKNLPIYKSLIDKIRASQHEFSNRIQNLEQLPYICKDYDSLCTALLKNTSDYKKPMRAYTLLQLDMPLLAATLYNLYMQAAEDNITILFDIASTHIESHAPEYVLADFVSILTQNAIEACQSEDMIYTHIVSTGGRLHFEIRNPVNRQYTTTELSHFFQKDFSTKSKQKTENDPNHGMGLYYLANEIRSYEGSIGIDCTRFENIYWIMLTLEV